MNKQSHPTLSIPIFLASDDTYAPFLCTTMYSILQNTKHTIEFYILDGGILDTSKVQITESLKHFTNFSVDYTDMSSFALDRFPNISYYTTNMFSRYFIPEIQPHVSKAIYLDVDIIVECDIVELYTQDLETYALGAVIQLPDIAGKQLKEKIYPTFKSESQYFNSGVLLIDLKKFRDENITQRLVSLTIEYKDILIYPDQDILNIFFDDNFKILDYSYNYITCHTKWIMENYPEEASYFSDTAKIIHFAGPKPWNNSSVYLSNKFWDTLKKTTFFEKVFYNFIFSQSTIHEQLVLTQEKKFRALIASQETKIKQLTESQKQLEQLILKLTFSQLSYYRYKILNKLAWGAKRKHYKEKYKRLKKIKNS